MGVRGDITASATADLTHLRAVLNTSDLTRAIEGAACEKVDATAWAVANGLVDEAVAFRALADHLGLPFTIEPPPGPVPEDLPCKTMFEKLVRQRGLADRRALIAPRDDQVAPWRRRLEDEPDLRGHFVVTTPSAARARLALDLAPQLEREAVHGLATRRPDLSAHAVRDRSSRTLTLLFILVAVLLLVPGDAWPGPSARVINAAFSLVFGAFVAARLATAFGTQPHARRMLMHAVPPPARGDVPFYSALVALYREGNQVRDIVAALDALDWPRARREIVLVCEADDAQTLDALSGLTLPPDFRVVAVPPSEPRTKPKALDFALPTCAGDIIVLYDAEDRPDPLQLREAWAAFAAGPEHLACVQAPLHIANAHWTNARAGWLPKLFAAEYSALFDSLLPALADRGGPVPLGGTSNHFKRAALDECGAWDGWNVTEDADLGIRLARAGWSIDTIARATNEEAPSRLRPWITQRTRWFKGWMQTWLVHMREPSCLRRELGPRAFRNFHLFITGMLVSALVHPLFLGSIAVNGALLAYRGWDGPDGDLHRWLIAVDLVVIVFGYAAFAIAAWRTMGLRRLGHLRPWLVLVPFYWVAMSFAAWRALVQLHVAPSKWEKTPHGLS